MPRRIKKAKIEFISLVPAGANKMPVLYKDDGMVEIETLVKASSDLGELTAVVYAPEHRDSQGDIASAEVVKDMAYDAARRGVEIDLRHDGKAVGRERAFVAESFLVAKGDERFQGWKDRDGKQVDLTGAWATVIKIEDPELRQLYRDGKWGGVSMAGQAEVIETEKADGDGETPPSWFHKAFTTALRAIGLGGTPTEEDIDMKKDELQEILKQDRADLVKDITAALGDTLAKALAKDAPADDADDQPADDQASVAKGDDGDDELERLRAENARLRKAVPSNREEGDDADIAVDGLSKEDAAAWERGVQIAKYLNGR
jgi:hypothetical protein